MKIRRLWLGHALAAAISLGATEARAQTGPMLTFLGIDLTSQYSVFDRDDLYMGTFRWIDGKYYVGVIDRRTCKTYFLLRNGAVMENGLTGNSNVQLGGGDHDRLTVQQASSSAIGGGAQVCPNAPALSPLNYAGYTLTLLGQVGDDDLKGSLQGITYLYGGSGDDYLESWGATNLAYGQSGGDYLMSLFFGCQMYGGEDNDYLLDGHSPRMYGEWYYGEAGRDCIWDPDTFTNIDCGLGDDRYGGSTGTTANCEGTAPSPGACYGWVLFRRFHG
jgi:hypothetical protein